MKNIPQIILLLFILLHSGKGYTQHIPDSDKFTSPPITLTDKVNKSDVVIEGEIINSASFLLDPKSRRPFTSSIIRVSKVFKGDIKDTIIELITEGGRLPDGSGGGPMGSFIGKGYEGLFFLRINNSTIQSGKNIEHYFLLYFNSYIYYSAFPQLTLHSAGFEGKNIDDFEGYLYHPIEAITGTPKKVIALLPFEQAEINLFSPENYKDNIPLSEKIQSPVNMSFGDRVNKSDAIVEGQVIGTNLFSTPKNLFTSATIKISKIFKGDIKDTIIEIITDGAIFPTGSRRASLWGMLSKGQSGLFFLRINNSAIQSGKKLQSYFYLYDHSFRLYDKLTKSNDLDKDIYQPIEAITGTPRKVIGLNLIEIEAAKKQQK